MDVRDHIRGPRAVSNLYVSPEAPVLLRGAAEAVLILHIGGGTVGMISGAAALLARKGGRWHRVAGTTFFASMLIMATIGAAALAFPAGARDGQCRRRHPHALSCRDVLG